MSFFYPNESKFIEGKVDFNYPNKTIYNKDVQEKLNYSQTMKKPNQYVDLEGQLIDIKDKYYEIRYQDKEMQFQDLKMNSGLFRCKKLYVYGLLHYNISQYSNQNIVGELIVEHEDNGPVKSNIYSCFLLQNNEKNIDNSTDKLINMIKFKEDNTVDILKEDLDLNKDIPIQNEIIYYEQNTGGKKKHIYIFLNPIQVNSDSSEFLKTLTEKTQLFETNSTLKQKYYSVDFTPKSTKEEFTNMFSSVREGYDGYYLDCKPAGESEASTPGYVAPVSSKFTASKQKVDNLTIFVDLLLFFLIVLVVFFNAPSLYKVMIIAPLVRTHTGVKSDKIYQAVGGIDLFLAIFNVVLVFALLIGAGYGMNSMFMMGISWMLLIFFTTLTIMLSKTSIDFWSLQNESGENSPEIEPPKSDQHTFQNFVSVLFDYINGLFSKSSDSSLLGELDQTKLGGNFVALVALICVIFLVILVPTLLRTVGGFNSNQSGVMAFIAILFSIIITFTVRVFSTQSNITS